ncbi:cation diffusion facilitator family transporter [Marinicella sp. W31]|uniref:cation diffusion facilitator family transporter n=1 Tax=Marinicella sp. W31 TaxID=3023713 RepID=UPI003757872C
MSHHHSHDDHGHDHAPKVTEDSKKRVFWAMLITASFMLAEVIGGLLSGSLALLADAAHMLTDAAALFLSWFAFRLSQKQSDPLRSYGFDRFQILAAFVNGLSLLVIAVWIVIEAIQRILEPQSVLALPMLLIAIGGLFINILVFWILTRGDQQNLNLKGALIHVIGDLLGSVAAIIAAVIIYYTRWYIADPILSVVVALLITRSGWHVVKKSTHILLQGSPENIDCDRIKEQLLRITGVSDVYHIHVWSMTNDNPILTMHALIDAETDSSSALQQIQSILADEFNISHSTVQIECENPSDYNCVVS